MHTAQLEDNLVVSEFTARLYDQYRKHLGFFRYFILIHVQYWITPPRVKHLLNLEPSFMLNMMLTGYKWSRQYQFGQMIKSWLLPPGYRQQVKELDIDQVALPA